MKSLKYLVLVLTFTAAGANAQSGLGTLAGTPIQPDSAITEILAQMPGQSLKLEDALQLAQKNSTQVLLAEAAMRAAKGSLRRARGGFDPEVFLRYGRLGNDMPSSSPFGGASVVETEQTNTSTGLRLKLPFGTQIEAGVDARKLKTNSAFAALNPEYSATSKLQLTQPLLKGFGPAAKSDLASARRWYDAAVARYEQAVLDLDADIEGKYWDLYAAERDLAVQMLVHDRGFAFQNQAEFRARAVLVGPSDVAKARVFVADQQQQVLDREEELDRASDELASMIGQRPAAGMRFRSADTPDAAYSELPSIETLLQQAFEQNRGLKASEMDLAAARALESGGRWNAWPTLDLVGSIGGNGLSGTAQEIEFGGETFTSEFDGSAGDSWSQAIGRDYQTWFLGFNFIMPIGLRPGGGERDRLIAERMRSEQLHIDARNNLEEDVRAYHRELIHAKLRLDAARDGVNASNEQVRIGVLEYNNGRISAVELVLLAEDLAKAQQSLTRALVKAAKARAGLKKLTTSPVISN